MILLPFFPRHLYMKKEQTSRQTDVIKVLEVFKGFPGCLHVWPDHSTPQGINAAEFLLGYEQPECLVVGLQFRS